MSKGRAEFLLLLLTVHACASSEVDDFVPYQGRRYDHFDWNLWKVVAKNRDGNALISPLSIKLALVLLYEGAQNQTAQELAMAMNLPASRPATRDLFSATLRSLKEEHPEYVLNIGTRMYIDLSIQIRQRYGATALTFYETEVGNIDFSDAKIVADDVNNWASNVTLGNIEKMIDDESRLKDSKVLITSALYFKGTWKNQPFSKDFTQTGKFMTSLDSSINVNFMQANNYFYFYQSPELDAKLLRLPYKGEKYAMYIVLPNASNGLNGVIEKMNPSVLNRIVWLMEYVSVDVKIPQFKFDSTSHLESNLRQVGIQDIFNEKAILSGIGNDKTSGEGLYVSDIVHKAGIEVNEQGTSSFATTEVQLGNKNSDQSFYAQHPFMFYIEDESTGTILFTGKVNNPLEASENAQETSPAPEVPSKFSEAVNVTSDVLGMGLDDRSNYFNLELIQKLYEQYESNAIVSPVSVKAALMTLIEATDGRTQQEILSALRLSSDLSSIRDAAHRNLGSFKNKSSGVDLNLATRFWIASDIQVAENYTNVLQQYYASDIAPVDFRSSNATSTINDWAQKMTQNRIKSIVEPGELDEETKIFVTSAIYFKSQWRNAFIPNRTKLGCFKGFEKDCEMVSMMENFDTYRYANVPALDAQVLEIPYSVDRFSFVIMLPNKEGKKMLNTLSRDLSYTPISLLLGNLERTEIELQMPKFNIEKKFSLKEILGKLEINDLFNSNANFSNTFSDARFHVKDIFQTANIDVSEEGTEASAITGLTIVPLMASTAISIRINRPFLFFVIDLSSNSILFAGKFVEPS